MGLRERKELQGIAHCQFLKKLHVLLYASGYAAILAYYVILGHSHYYVQFHSNSDVEFYGRITLAIFYLCHA